ncbi:D-2-hydroxyacid dehydrogenase [Candidatus Bipolaricaulota bacterium]|jgi:D-3-phosphoglycerate dehydrogenase|nr:D-2-hydroxyacid dehydrogenase [Candidatus Bipolaricaulota bacterium]TFH11422.1 MAG: 3-phosphoglycerate dehydrogenase [Candidatus Atribacteria bacterium]
MGFRVLASDPLDPKAVAAMREAGLEVDEKTDLTPEQLVTEIAVYDAIVIRSATKVRANIIDAGANLKLVVRAGVGLDNVDVDYAVSKGLSVRNTPAASSNSVAELAIGHMFSLARHISRATASTKAGAWEKKQLKGIEIAGKTLGIVGIGRIGQSLAKKAAALGMNVLCSDAYLTQSPIADIAAMVPLDELLEKSDFISLHIPFDPNVGPSISTAQFAIMKDGAYLVNCARGGVIDEGALVEALKSGKVAGVALDVFETEPPAADHPLFAFDNVSLTPHIGAATDEAQARVGGEAADIVIEFARSSS